MLNKTIINLTARPINIYAFDGTLEQTIAPSGRVARVIFDYETKGDNIQPLGLQIRGFPPSITQNSTYIVEKDVKMALRAIGLDKNIIMVPADDVMSNGKTIGSTVLLY